MDLLEFVNDMMVPHWLQRKQSHDFNLFEIQQMTVFSADINFV